MSSSAYILSNVYLALSITASPSSWRIGLRVPVAPDLVCPFLARFRTSLPPAAVWLPVCCLLSFSSSFFLLNCSSRSLDLLALAGFFFLELVLVVALVPAFVSTLVYLVVISCFLDS